MTETLAESDGSDRSDPIISPGLVTDQKLGAAYELKFLLTLEQAAAAEQWAHEFLRPDSHGDQGRYRVASIYCDTALFNVFHRSPGYRRTKIRIRRYGDSAHVFLERKTKKKDRVHKMRVELAPDQLSRLDDFEIPLEGSGLWFHRRIQRRGLRPACQIAYNRRAFFGQFGASPVRLTLDRDLIGGPASTWSVPDLTQGQALFGGGAVLEMKYHNQMPEAFRQILSEYSLTPTRISKYRRCVEVCALAPPPPLPVIEDANLEPDVVRGGGGAEGSSSAPRMAAPSEAALHNSPSVLLSPLTETQPFVQDSDPSSPRSSDASSVGTSTIRNETP